MICSLLIRRRCIRRLCSHGLLHVNRNVKGSLLCPKLLPCLVSFSTQGQPPKLPHHKPDLPFPQDPSAPAPALIRPAPSPGAAHQGPGSRTTIWGIHLFLWVSFLTPRGRQTYSFQINPVLSPRKIPRAIAERVKVSLCHPPVLPNSDGGPGGGQASALAGMGPEPESPHPPPRAAFSPGTGEGGQRQGCGCCWAPGFAYRAGNTLRGLICLRSCTCRHMIPLI